MLQGPHQSHGLIPQIPLDFHYVRSKQQICSGWAFTDDQPLGCNGWQGITEQQCQQKCTAGVSVHAPHCPAKECYATSFFPSSGWCHLFEPAECRSLIGDSSAVSSIKTKKGIFDDIPGMDKVTESLQTPMAKKAIAGTGIVVAAGVAAAGVGAAIYTRQQAELQQARSTDRPTSGVFLGQKPTGAPPGAPTFGPFPPPISAKLAAGAAAKPAAPVLTSLTEAVQAGATALAVKVQTGFIAGSKIVIGAGTPQEELNYIVGFGSVLLKEPLKFAHAAGVTISSVAEVITAAPTAEPNVLSDPTSSSGFPLWVPLVVLVCCCISAVLTAMAFSGRRRHRGNATRDRSYSEDSYIYSDEEEESEENE